MNQQSVALLLAEPDRLSKPIEASGDHLAEGLRAQRLPGKSAGLAPRAARPSRRQHGEDGCDSAPKKALCRIRAAKKKAIGGCGPWVGGSHGGVMDARCQERRGARGAQYSVRCPLCVLVRNGSAFCHRGGTIWMEPIIPASSCSRMWQW
jgi:hypothetical protein